MLIDQGLLMPSGEVAEEMAKEQASIQCFRCKTRYRVCRLGVPHQQLAINGHSATQPYLEFRLHIRMTVSRTSMLAFRL